MEEKLTPELRKKLIKKVKKVVEADAINVSDALMILDVCSRALSRGKAELAEKYMESAVSQDK